jgi:hypothetical protein
MIKQNINKLRKINLSVSKIFKYDNSSFRQAMKYYTIKSESKTIQIEELSAYLRPIRNLLGFSKAHKMKTQNNINSCINIHINFDDKNNSNNNNINKKVITNYKDKNKNNSKSNILNREYNSITQDENNNKNLNHKESINDNDQHTNGKNENKKNSNINNKMNLNTSLTKNCVFNDKIPYTQRRNNKMSKIPFSIKIDKIISTEKPVITNENINNKASINIMNSKISDNDTQISTNNNMNNLNQENKMQQSQSQQSQTLYQFRPRKIHLPKSVINLSSIQLKNKILQNILNKRKNELIKI